MANLQRIPWTMLQIDDQVFATTYGAAEDKSLDGSRAQEVAQFHRRGEIVRSKAALPDGRQRFGQSPLGEVQHPFQRNGYAKDDARIPIEGYLGVATEALFPGEHLPRSAPIGLRQKDGSGSN
jgi:hypothetical protein